MDRSEILDKLFEYKSRYQNEYHFTRIGIFGSAARGTAENQKEMNSFLRHRIDQEAVYV
ncbi:Uncharacterized protein dnl_16520 [Desulfonema limicola]|uniref:Nucleotidyltransferase n=1 Tax=Desulfonema limicola TaxID=45656 RepID=A0A975B5X3_9BACT|nr:hypothetical protein [Desulfonema limicola]QTA79384.1 Uncharacterized protein dnl_16520 [Desulfonema limicola]